MDNIVNEETLRKKIYKCKFQNWIDQDKSNESLIFKWTVVKEAETNCLFTIISYMKRKECRCRGVSQNILLSH